MRRSAILTAMPYRAAYIKAKNSPLAHLKGVILSLLLVAAMTVVLAIIVELTDIRHISIGYMIPVTVAALRWGVPESIIAAIVSVGASAFFFYAPIYDFAVHDPLQIIDLILFMCVTVVTGHLASRLRIEVERANQGELEIRGLYVFSRRLAMAQNASDIMEAIRQHLSALAGRKVFLFSATAAPAEFSGDNALPDAVAAIVRDVMAHPDIQQDGTIVDDGSGNAWLVRSLSPRRLDHGVIAVDLGPQTGEAEREISARIGAILSDATETLEQLGISAAINDARIRTETDRFRDALIGSVSHELRTPLSSIMGAATVLSGAPAVQREAQLAALANVVREEAVRLNNDIQNLLDATRISSQGVEPKLSWTEPIDIVNSALERRRAGLADHQVEVSLQDNLPLIYVDSLLVEQALVQVIDNAGKYSAAGSKIQIEGRQQDDQIVLSVTDHGAGIAPEDKAKLGERFFRGSRHAATTAGSGLGLWIAKSFLSAHGGTLIMDSVDEGGGTTVSLRLPVPLMTADQMIPSHE